MKHPLIFEFQRNLTVFAYNTTIESGVRNDIDEYVENTRPEHKTLFDQMLFVAYQESLDNPVMLKAVLRSLLSIEHPDDLNIILIPTLCSQHQDPEIREMCIACFEHWADKPAMFYLMQFKPDSEQHLNDYRLRVIADIATALDLEVSDYQ